MVWIFRLSWHNHRRIRDTVILRLHLITDEETADRVLLALSETVGNRLREDNVQIEVVSVGIRYSDLSYVSHQKVLPIATNLTWEIYKAACELFWELWNQKPVRHLRIHTSRVKHYNFFRQIALFDETDYEKLEKWDKTVDELWKRFGADVIMRASFVKQPIDHMSGSISREKRTVDYDKIKVD